MGLTVTNVNALTLLNILNRTSAEQSNTLTRLSTGLRINTGKDDPAGLIAVRGLEAELTAVDASIVNNQRTDSILNTAESAITEVASLLQEIERLAVASANKDGISSEELAANQEQIDQAISALDRIIGETEFNGKKLLDGSLGINVTGVDATKLTNVRVFRRDPENSISLTVSLTTAATRAVHALATTSAASDTSISLQGSEGTVVIDIATGENLSSVEAKIDNAQAQTGANAYISGATLYVRSVDYGADEFVRVTVLSGDTTNVLAGSDYGSDAVVTVNGQSAATDGLNVSYSANDVSVSFKLTENYNNGAVTGDETFTITNTGGATFQLGTETTTRITIGIDGLFAAQLGSAGTGYLSTLRGGENNNVIDNPAQAAQIAREALGQVSKLQGQIGGVRRFQVDTALNQQNATKESLTSALTVIRDADYATETANLNRQNVLLQSAISLLGLANQQSGLILSLLR